MCCGEGWGWGALTDNVFILPLVLMMQRNIPDPGNGKMLVMSKGTDREERGKEEKRGEEKTVRASVTFSLRRCVDSCCTGRDGVC